MALWCIVGFEATVITEQQGQRTATGYGVVYSEGKSEGGCNLLLSQTIMPTTAVAC